MNGLAQAVLDEVFAGLQIDDQWSLRGTDRFTWWASRHAQTVRVAEAAPGVMRVTVETDLVKTGVATAHLHEAVSVWGADATLNAPILERDMLVLRASAHVNEDNRAWTSRILQFAAVIQVTAAHRQTAWAQALSGEEAISSHPRSGVREKPDEILGALEQLPEAPGWDDESEFEQTVEMLLSAGLFASGGGRALTVEFPFGPNGGPAATGGASNLLQVTGEEAHPVLGPGLTLRLRLRYAPVDSSGSNLAPSELNSLEETDGCQAHLFGSWAFDQTANGSAPYFGCFVPAILHQPSVLPNLAFSMGARSNWISQYFAED